jgi:hypothetical protein
LQVERFAKRVEAFCEAQTAPQPYVALELPALPELGFSEPQIAFVGPVPEDLAGQLLEHELAEGLYPASAPVKRAIADHKGDEYTPDDPTGFYGDFTMDGPRDWSK